MNTTETKNPCAFRTNYDSYLYYDIMGGNNIDAVGGNNLIAGYKNDKIMIDRGLLITTKFCRGTRIDGIVPNYDTYYREILAIIITHGHMDHIGGLAPDALRGIELPPVYCTPVARALIENDFIRRNVDLKQWPEFRQLPVDGTAIQIGALTIGAFQVSHSIPEACGLVIGSPVGTIVHSGDFKTDPTVPVGPCYDSTQTRNLCQRITSQYKDINSGRVNLLAVDSTRAHVPGFPLSEADIGDNIRDIVIENPDKRIICAMFSSHISRIVQMADLAADTGRTLIIHGASISQNLKAMVRAAEIHHQSGTQPAWLTTPVGALFDKSNGRRPGKTERLLQALTGKKIIVREGDSATARNLPPCEQLVLCTGTQGEKNASLYRAATGVHPHLDLSSGDLVIISASRLPDSQFSIKHMLDALAQKTPHIYAGDTPPVHTSGHGRAADISTLVQDTAPEFVLPIHGNRALLLQHAATLAVNHGHETRIVDGIQNGTRIKISGNGSLVCSPLPNPSFIAICDTTYQHGIIRGHFAPCDEFGNIIVPSVNPSPGRTRHHLPLSSVS